MKNSKRAPGLLSEVPAFSKRGLSSSLLYLPDRYENLTSENGGIYNR